jgi:hypothetical protein
VRKRKVNGAHHSKGKKLTSAVPVVVPNSSQSAPPVSFARFGEYVVLRMSDLEDLAELVARLDRWRPIAELVKPR